MALEVFPPVPHGSLTRESNPEAVDPKYKGSAHSSSGERVDEDFGKTVVCEWIPLTSPHAPSHGNIPPFTTIKMFRSKSTGMSLVTIMVTTTVLIIIALVW